MSYVEDTQIKDGHYKPGTILDDGKWRVEFDSMGQVKVPADRLWGAQTQRSLIHFSIGNDHMPIEVYHAYGIVKKAAALLNGRSGRLPQDKADLIVKAADEVIAGKLDGDFPLYVWQTGSGTQSNMNVNEVISNRAIQMVKGTLGAQEPVHPNDHVNMSQSSNDTFPSAMHIAAVKEIRETLLPKVGALTTAIEDKANEWEHVIKIGRTHLQDAVPLTVGQEWSGYAAQMRDALARVEESMTGLYKLAVGGTAVGTGLNSPVHFDVEMATEIATLTTYPFITAPNKFAAQGSLDAMVAAPCRSTRTCGFLDEDCQRYALARLRSTLRHRGTTLPANEPGSSIMPGKVNPTECEAMVMICIQVIGDDAAVAFAGSQGNFELNAMRPIIINNFLHSARILADGCEKLRMYSVAGTQINETKVAEYVKNSLMLVTALSPVIGYDKASEIAHTAQKDGSTLREAAVKSGYIDEKKFDEVVDPRKMISNKTS